MRSELTDAVRDLDARLSRCGVRTIEAGAQRFVVNPETGAALSASLTRSRLEEILDEHDAYRQLDQTTPGSGKIDDLGKNDLGPRARAPSRWKPRER